VGRLLKRGDFLAAARGKRASTALFTLQAVARSKETNAPARLGLTVSRKTGGAVERNRIRRRLRHAMRQIAPLSARAGHDYVIIARRQVLGAPFPVLLNELKSAFGRVHQVKSG